MNRIENFYTTWIAQLDDYLNDYIFDSNNNLLKTRSAFRILKRYLNKLLTNGLEPPEKIILLPGLRGVGKTTLLAQLYFYGRYIKDDSLTKIQDIFKLYISVDRLYALGIRLIDFYEFLKTFVLVKYPKHKILLLVDEIQYDQQWALFLKLVFDENFGNRNLLLVATGSSSLLLNTKNQDLVRRSITHRILPEKFTEFLLIHKNVYPTRGVSQQLQTALFLSNNAEESFNKIFNLKPEIIEQLSQILNLPIVVEEYLNKGTFPFSASLNDSQAMQKIREMILVNIVQKDILQLGNIESEVLSRIPDLLFLLANSDEITTGNIAKILQLSVNTVNKLIDLLKKAELLIEIKPYGRPYAQIRKSSKLLFISPNIRWALLQGFVEKHRGKLLEDYIAFTLYKEISNRAIILHDFAKHGADFIIRYPDNSEIVIEVGFGKNTQAQIENTIKRTQGRAKYGVIIGSKDLKLSDNIVWVPLEYILLM